MLERGTGANSPFQSSLLRRPLSSSELTSESPANACHITAGHESVAAQTILQYEIAYV